MPDLETCRRNILSEDYRDFIENRTRTPLFNELLLQNPCEQDAGSGYTCYYFPKESVEPITLSRFSYNSIPQCFSPLSMETPEPGRNPSGSELSYAPAKRAGGIDRIFGQRY